MTDVNVTSDFLTDVISLLTRLRNLSRIGVICHCTRFEPALGLESSGGVNMYFTPQDSQGNDLEARVIAFWNYELDAENHCVIMRRGNGGNSLKRYARVNFFVTDTDEEIRNKLIDALEELRRGAGVIAAPEDVQALRDAIIEADGG